MTIGWAVFNSFIIQFSIICILLSINNVSLLVSVISVEGIEGFFCICVCISSFYVNTYELSFYTVLCADLAITNQ